MLVLFILLLYTFVSVFQAIIQDFLLFYDKLLQILQKQKKRMLIIRFSFHFLVTRSFELPTESTLLNAQYALTCEDSP